MMLFFVCWKSPLRSKHHVHKKLQRMSSIRQIFFASISVRIRLISFPCVMCICILELPAPMPLNIVMKTTITLLSRCLCVHFLRSQFNKVNISCGLIRLLQLMTYICDKLHIFLFHSGQYSSGAFIRMHFVPFMLAVLSIWFALAMSTRRARWTEMCRHSVCIVHRRVWI